MKKLLLLLTITVTLSCCNKNDDDQPTNPIDQLPPATQIGANTFGALLDGEPFIPSGGTNPLDCVYQFVNGGYFFALQGNKRDSNNNLITIAIGINNLQIEQGESYDLLENVDGNASGGTGFTFTIADNQSSSTNSQFTGELTITKLDFTNNIVSGTFWFDVEHPVTGETVEIREGRFDTLFTQ